MHVCEKNNLEFSSIVESRDQEAAKTRRTQYHDNKISIVLSLENLMKLGHKENVTKQR